MVSPVPSEVRGDDAEQRRPSLSTTAEESFLAAYKEGGFHYLLIAADRV